MLKELFFRFIDLLDAVLFEPFRIENTISTWGDSPLKFAKLLILLLASLSAAAGTIFIAPPFTSRSLLFLSSGFLFHLFFFYLLPYPLAYTIDGLAQRKDRKANSKLLLHTIRIAVSVFITAGAWAVILALMGFTGKPGILLLYIVHYGFFMAVIVRSVMYLYDLKLKDALFFNIITFVITFFFPVIMYVMLAVSFASTSQ